MGMMDDLKDRFEVCRERYVKWERETAGRKMTPYESLEGFDIFQEFSEIRAESLRRLQADPTGRQLLEERKGEWE